MPVFTSEEFKNILKQNAIYQVTSASNNGLAKRAVQTFKEVMKFLMELSMISEQDFCSITLILHIWQLGQLLLNSSLDKHHNLALISYSWSFS